MRIQERENEGKAVKLTGRLLTNQAEITINTGKCQSGQKDRASYSNQGEWDAKRGEAAGGHLDQGELQRLCLRNLSKCNFSIDKFSPQHV